MDNIPNDVRLFVFEHVDSVAQLDVLFLLRQNPESEFDADGASKELRTNLDSAAKNLVLLKSLGLLQETSPGKFRYLPRTPELGILIDRLEAVYKIRQHKVLELIFSAAKRARQFADAFTIAKNPSNDGDDNG